MGEQQDIGELKGAVPLILEGLREIRVDVKDMRHDMREHREYVDERLHKFGNRVQAIELDSAKRKSFFAGGKAMLVVVGACVMKCVEWGIEAFRK